MARLLSELLSMLPFAFEAPNENPRITAPITENASQVERGGVFLARKGRTTDGHRYIPQAVERGAAAIVGERPYDEVQSLLNGVPYARVENGYEAFGYLVSGYEGNPSRNLIVIGVTGTNGKTTTATLIYHILKTAGVHVGLISTVNAVIGDRTVPTGLHVTNPPAHELQRYLREMVEAGMTHCVLELTSMGLEQGRVNGTQIDVAVMTNVTHEHLDWHGSFENYKRAKMRLFEIMKNTPRKGTQPNIAVINADDPTAPDFAEASIGADYMLLYSTYQSDADLYADRIHYGADFTSFMLRGNAGDIPIRSPLLGQYNVQNILAAIGGAISAMPQPEHQQRMINAIPLAISQVPQIPGRLERIDEGQDFIAIVDFAHTHDALEKVLQTARQMLDEREGRVIAVFGSAGLRDVEKRRLMAEVSAELADITILTAEDPRTESLLAILETMRQAAVRKGCVEGESLFVIPDRGRAIFEACQIARAGDIVLACGKGHEQSMCFGTVEYEWDDRVAMRSALKGQPLLTLPSATLPYDERELWRND
ncbi:MAG: UDP-N-acetylmuramoyl-L-alanyl-D-glutamate--2,6-diaminopimelate ligase [Phototrophicales bacterium]|nr:MAG: UDP-N-acetylmuramoyl-L-alanyl-D-glutamate--2,6-diaminopimelate ligase [Phototrophicales bacterium]